MFSVQAVARLRRVASSRGALALPREAALAYSRVLSTPLVTAVRSFHPSSPLETSIPPGEAPQILISALGAHRAGATRDLTAVLFEQGASVASTKKIMVEDHFAMLLSVWTPPEGPSPEELLKLLVSPATESRLGFPLSVKLLEANSPSRAPRDATVQRRLKIQCPQKPGIILAVTELLKDRGCALSSIEADTFAKGAEIWFEIQGVIDIPEGVEPASIEKELRFWTSSNEDAKLVFDEYLRAVTPIAY